MLVFRLSAVVLYRSAMEYNVSFAPTVMAIHPPGMVQVTACASVAVGDARTTNSVAGVMNAVGDGIADGTGDANSTAKVVGIGEGVGGREGADDSARDNEMPPITSRREIAPMMNPLPIWRRAFILILRRFVQRHRQQHTKRGALAGLALHPNAPILRFGQCLGNG